MFEKDLNNNFNSLITNKMSETRTSIFSFDHGQKKLHKAIGVEDSYLDDLQEQIGDVLKNYLFDEDRNIKDDLSPSGLVEKCLHEFSYNQLVIMASFFLQNKLNDFAQTLHQKLEGAVKKISLDADDVPEHIREFLMNLAKDGQGDKKATAVRGEDLPQEIKDFLDDLARKSEDAEDDDED
jgi:hypothetical protein